MSTFNNIKRTPLAPASFSVGARVAMQLGRESISSSYTAIVELVKNAYDADAELVKLMFHRESSGAQSLIISDNGHGMTESELRDYWLLIGTTNKRNTTKSKGKKRVQTGEKGLGRLGLDRLCARTTLQTLKKLEKSPGTPEMFPEIAPSALELDLDWTKYENTNGRLESVSHSLVALSNLDFDPITLENEDFPYGTRMVLRHLKDEWGKDEISELRTELSLLLSPFAAPGDFQIVLDSGFGDDEIDGIIEPDSGLLDLATWKVKASIRPVEPSPNASEVVSIEMSSTAHDRAFILPDTNWAEFLKHEQFSSEQNRLKSRCGPLDFEFYVFIRDSQTLNERGTTLPAISEFLESNRGIRIYRDGFRVKPFGDPAGENDWLRLSLKRASNPAAISRSSWSLAYHQVIGAVLISRGANPDLADQTNREGIVHGSAYDDLRRFATKVIKYFEGRAHEDHVAQGGRHPKEDEKPPPQPLKEAQKAVKRLLDESVDTDGRSDSESGGRGGTAKEVFEALEAAEKEQTSSEERHKAEVANLKEELALMTSLASLGVMTASFGHERVNDTTEVLNHAARLRQYIKDPQKSLFEQQEVLVMLDALLVGAGRLDAFANFALDHVRPRKRRGHTKSLPKVVDYTLNVFREILEDRYKIDVIREFSLDEDFGVKGWEAGWESVLVNFISNACWALEKTHKEKRRISIQLISSNSTAILVFEDSGVGLEGGATKGDIFRPGFSTKRDHHGHQDGTGMGLALVATFIKSIGGTIEVDQDGPLGGARFTVSTRAN